MRYKSKADFLMNAFPWPKSVQFIGAQGYIKLDAERRAVITLRTWDTAQHYEQLAVEIVSKLSGTINAKSFKFSEHLRQMPRPNKQRQELMVIEYVAWEWYIAKPVSTKPIVDAIVAYTKMFK